MQDNTRILGPNGQPIKRDQLTREMAAPTLTGLRSAWSIGSVASGLTPSRLASLLNSASDGDALDYLVLAEEMEEREPHYASVLGTRKRAVSGIEPSVEAASDETRDVELADAVRKLIREPAFGEMTDEPAGCAGQRLLCLRDSLETAAKPPGVRTMPGAIHASSSLIGLMGVPCD